MSDVVIWASGYPRPFHTDADEIKSSRAKTWSPSSRDFEVAARRSSKVALGAATLDEMLGHIAKQTAGSISRLGIIGHANGTMFGLAGRIITDPKFGAPDVLFTDPIDAAMLTAKAQAISKVTDRFTPDATITLYGCNAGVTSEYLGNWMDAFQVEILEGFQ